MSAPVAAAPAAAPAAIGAAVPPSTAAATSAPATQQAALPPASPPTAIGSKNPTTMGATTAAAPSFDVVRVDPTGSLVIAGRAAPGSAVTVTSDGAAIGTATADANGEWVILPETKVTAGNHELALSATSPTGATLPADRLVMLAVPASGRDATGQRAAAPGGSLALLVPKGDNGGTVVLQQPGAPDVAPAAPAVTASGAVPAPAVPTTATTEGGKAVAQSGGISNGALALDAVDYDDRGGVTIGGRGSIGATVQVYLDNQLIGAAMVDPTGRWQVTPNGDVAPRLHTLRVDQIARDGKVVARVESPFLRAETMTLPADQAFVVQPGNSLWRIARRTYGNGLRYSVIYAANRAQIRNPDLIYPGQVFAIPSDTQTN
jgi:nucleoid-associated protein YgaU